jgi:glucoamylase
VQDAATRDAGLGVFVADLPVAGLPTGTVLSFTFYWPDANRWEGVDFAVKVGGRSSGTGSPA